MGLDTKRPPLPAPTDISSADHSSAVGISDFATDISTRTDKTSYSIPEDGSPVTISTKKHRSDREQSQTSLLIEYFEAGKSGDKVHSRPSVRVRVTPSSSRKSRKAHDHIQITETHNRKPSYTRRISLPGKKSQEVVEGTELSSHSEASSSRPPVEVEVLQNLSELSRSELSPTRFVPLPSDISSIPPESLLGVGSSFASPHKHNRSLERGLESANTAVATAPLDPTVLDTLKSPSPEHSRSRSRERIVQMAAEKVQKGATSRSRAKGKDIGSRSRSISKEYIIDEDMSEKRRSSSSRDTDHHLGREPPSLVPSEITAASRKSDRSMRSTASTTSINNPKLLGIVEDTIKRLILPELNALKEEQKITKNRLKYEDITRDARAPVGSREELHRISDSHRLSKTSSLPSVRPDIYTDDRGLIHASESTRSRKSRRSSRGSTSDRSLETTVRDGSSRSRRRSSGEKRRHSHSKKEAAVAGGLLGAAAGLTAANLKHHNSFSSHDGERRERRKKRSKSRSRSASIAESMEEALKRESVPPLPMQSAVNSDLTRDSILSADTERPPSSRGSASEQTPVRELHEVMRGSPRHVISPTPRTPTRELSSSSLRETHSPRSPRSLRSDRSGSKAKAAGLAAAGLAAGTALAAVTRDKKGRDTPQKALYEPATPTKTLSPVQSDTSFREDRGEYLEHERVRSIKSAGSIGSAKKAHRTRSPLSEHSVPTSPHAFNTKKRPQGISLEKAYEVLPEEEYVAETPVQSDVEDWLERGHEENEQYRSEISQLEPSEVDHARISTYTEGSAADEYDEQHDDERDIQMVSSNPEYVYTPLAVESAVASLHDPSILSVQSSPKHSAISAAKEAQAPVTEREVTRENTIQGVGVQRQPTSKERWEAIRDRAMASSGRYQEGGHIDDSPRPSETRSMDLLPKMGASAIPQPGEEMPEIGHGLDDESEMITNPSIIQGPIGGLQHEDRSHWPYEPTPDLNGIQDREIHHTGHDAALLGTAAAAAGAAIGLGVANAHNKEAPSQQGFESPSREYQPHVEDEYESAAREVDVTQEPYPQQMYTPSPAHMKDEGYQSAAQPGGLSPEPFRPSRPLDTTSFDQFGDDVGQDPFMAPKHLRHESGLSHGMSSPLYDAATGKGIDRIQSRDIVALMDHLTVRDAQRNARDTEILVTLVRSAAEMRNSFEEMKRFIVEQDKMIVSNMDRDADLVVQRVLGGPRPIPPKASPRAPTLRSQPSEDEDVPQKRRNVLRRALKSLGSRNSNELAKIEGMLMQLLTEVEGLKDTQSIGRAPTSHAAGSINSYEHLRNNPDSGYEPSGQAGTSSTPNQSGYLSNPSSRHLNGTMHSGFERRGSGGHRISTVLEEDLDDHQHPHLSPQEGAYEDEERMLTPSQEVRQRTIVPMETPPEQTAPRFQGHNSMSVEDTPQSGKSRKHSSIFSGFPRISRWSKTTTSTVPDSAPPSAGRKDGRPMSTASRSGSNLDLNDGYNDNYELNEDDRIRSQSSLLRDVKPRPPSPLIPEDDDGMDDPKYQAHRNSLNLQHPQPRQGPTHRHQTYLESQAMSFEQPPTPDADQWGSAPALAINRSRFSGASTQTGGNLSPVYSDGGYSAHSASEQTQPPPRPPKVRDDGPLVPLKDPIPSSSTWERPIATTSSAGGAQTFPYGSPMLNPDVHIPSPLEPIQEVRYSLETDRHSLRQQMTPSPRPTAMQSVTRKITGPREMPTSTRSPSGNGLTAGVRRKAVGSANQAKALSPVSMESYRSSIDDEMF